MGCNPILQLALQLYYMHQSPIAPSSSPIVEIAKSIKLLKGTKAPSSTRPAASTPSSLLTRRLGRISSTTITTSNNAVFGHLVHAVSDTSGVSYFKFDDNGLTMLLNWRAWATKTSLDHRQHLALGSAAPPYTAADVTRLKDGLRRFAEAIDLEQADREVIATLATTNAVHVSHEPDHVPSTAPPPPALSPTPATPCLESVASEGPPIPVLAPPPAKKVTSRGEGKGKGRKGGG